VSEFDDFKFFSVYAFENNARIDNTTKLCIKRTGLTTGKWILYLTFYRYGVAPTISPWGVSGVAQKATLDTFLASSPNGVVSQARIYKFANSVIATIYSTALVTQDIL
jgi:hypothetical protein